MANGNQRHINCCHGLQEEEEYLINLMREQQLAEKRAMDAEAAVAKREAAKQEMLAANALQLQRKVRLGPTRALPPVPALGCCD